MFYREVVQAILMYGSEMWVISVEMERKVEGTHTGFLIQVTGKRARRWKVVMLGRRRETPRWENDLVW